MKHFYLIVFASFFMGYISGLFIFFASRSPVEATENVATDFEIIAETYGGCAVDGCSSYRVLEDGSYTYFSLNQASGANKYEDELSKKQIRELIGLVKQVDYAAVLDEPAPGICPAEFGSTAYRYTITLKGERYAVDSCKHNTTNNDLFTELRDYFKIFEATYR